MSVFHICSDYARQSLYPNLLRAISTQGFSQFMYVPTRTEDELNVGQITDDPNIRFRFKYLLRRYHKIFFRRKIKRIVDDIVKSTPISTYRCIHAHFLYSDGAVALALHRKFRIPYIVAVRNADVNSFMRLRPDLVSIRNAVLENASRVVFLSPAYANAVLHKLKPSLRKAVCEKMIIIPNGIPSDWFSAETVDISAEISPSSVLRLLYVGDFTPNKNIAGIISALRLLQTDRAASLTVVGGGGDNAGRVQRLIERSVTSGVNYVGRVNNRAELQSLYRSHDIFLMPSFRETFGLAYIEALSQGVPVVHSEGQGVDGYFTDGTIAVGVNPKSASSIATGVQELASRLPKIRETCRQKAKQFDWQLIGETYRDVYNSTLGDLR